MMRGLSAVAVVVGWLLVAAPTGSRHAISAQASGIPSTSSEIGVAERRVSHLRRGINLTDWIYEFPDGKTYTNEQFEARVSPRAAAYVRSLGFDHVRLCVNPQALFRPLQADRLPAEPLAYLDRAVDALLNAGLAVELDLQADDAFKRRLADDAFVEQLADFWRALAAHYAARDPERLFFEVLNEPELRDQYRWYGIETKLVGAIREAAPRHTVIVTGARFSADDDLVALEPLRDANVVYAFHFYEPYVFTHQGATWAENYTHHLEGVPYPSSPEAAKKAAARVPDPVRRLALARYGLSQWNAARIDLEIGQVVEWAAKWHVPIVCNEFGVYRKVAPAADRLAWITDVRTALERHGVGWAMWEYHGGFGVLAGEGGEATADEATLRALGLPLPSAAPR